MLLTHACVIGVTRLVRKRRPRNKNKDCILSCSQTKEYIRALVPREFRSDPKDTDCGVGFGSCRRNNFRRSQCSPTEKLTFSGSRSDRRSQECGAGARPAGKRPQSARSGDRSGRGETCQSRKQKQRGRRSSCRDSEGEDATRSETSRQRVGNSGVAKTT